MIDAYKKYRYGDATLRDLPDHPRFVFNSTNLSTGVNFLFAKLYAAGYRIGIDFTTLARRKFQHRSESGQPSGPKSGRPGG